MRHLCNFEKKKTHNIHWTLKYKSTLKRAVGLAAYFYNVLTNFHNVTVICRRDISCSSVKDVLKIEKFLISIYIEAPVEFQSDMMI